MSKLDIKYPASRMNYKSEKKYNALLRRGHALEAKLAKARFMRVLLETCEDPLREHYDKLIEAVYRISDVYAQAIEICDEDEKLHRKLYCYAQTVIACKPSY